MKTFFFRVVRHVAELFLVMCVPSFMHYAQTTGIQELRDAADAGDVVRLKRKLAEAGDRMRNDPGYFYMKGRSEEDGDSAVQYYRLVLDRFPASEWADDALYRLYQYSCAVGAYRTADAYMARLKTDYPSSPYLAVPRSTALAERVPSFSVQVGAFKEAEEAQILAERLRKDGYTVEVREKKVGDRLFQAVWVGRFATRQEARNFAARLAARHRLEGIVVRLE
ncbi:MAG: SPOR domain-containing protein [Bacteroidota bacterium]|nr:SPOR domain-containing protein [Bacteroidota bacterium]